MAQPHLRMDHTDQGRRIALYIDDQFLGHMTADYAIDVADNLIKCAVWAKSSMEDAQNAPSSETPN